MPRFYFDYEDHAGITIDDVGEEFATVEAATREAMLALGDAAKDFVHRNLKGHVVVWVRDAQRPILEVSATFNVTPIIS
jgi:hypothetical protein